MLPLIFSIYIKFCKSFCLRNSIDFLEYLNVIENIDEDENKTWDFSFKPEYSKDSAKLLNELSRDYLLLNYIKYHAESIEKKGMRIIIIY